MVMFDNIEEIFQNWREFNEYTKALVTLATATGTLFILYYFVKLVFFSYRVLRLYVGNQLCHCTNLVEKYGKWAVISGATDGIGLSMAKELARKGHSIIIIGRNEEKLAQSKLVVEQESGAEVITVKIDLSDSSLANYEKIKSQIDPDNRDIGILINNAGTFSDKLTRYVNHDTDYIRTTVNVNILATLYFTKLIMPGMLDRGKGLVVNVSSMIGSMPAPYAGVYGPTKAFMDSFSRTLQMEYSSHPIDIINLAPGPVVTKLYRGVSKFPKPSFYSPSSDEYARVSLNAIPARFPYISGVFTHEVMLQLYKIINKFGLLPFVVELCLKFGAKNYQVSPVMKRKKPAVSFEASGEHQSDGEPQPDVLAH